MSWGKLIAWNGLCGSWTLCSAMQVLDRLGRILGYIFPFFYTARLCIRHSIGPATSSTDLGNQSHLAKGL